MTDKDPKNKPENDVLHGIAATDIAHRHGPELPYIDHQVRRAVQTSVAPNGRNGPLQALKLLWPIALRYVTTREAKGNEVFSVSDGELTWLTSLVSRDRVRCLTLTWTVEEDGTLSQARMGWSNTPPKPFVHRRYLPVSVSIQITQHGLDQSMARGQGHLPRDVVATNLLNRFHDHQSNLKPVQTSYYVDEHQKVFFQYLIPDGQGSVCALRLSQDGMVLYHATTLSGEMAEAQVTLTNSTIASATRHWHNDGSGAPGVIA